MLSKCGWTPFAGRTVTGRIEQVFLRGSPAYERGRCLLKPGSGKPVLLES